MSFSYFPKVALDHRVCPLLSRYPLKFCESCYNTQFKSYAASKMELSVIKIGNRWKYLFTSVAENFVLNVSGLLDPTLKQIDKFRWWRWIIPSDIYMFKLNNNKKNTRNVSNILKWTICIINIPEGHLLLLLLTLNILYFLFCCYYHWIRISKCCLGLKIYSSGNKFVFSTFEKYIVI